MKMRNVFAPQCALVCVCLAAIQTAAAQVYDLHWKGRPFTNFSIDTTGFTSLKVTQNDTWDGSPGFSGMLMFDDVIYTEATQIAYRDTTWVAPGVSPGVPRAAAISTVDDDVFPFLEPIRRFDTNALRLEGVDLSLLNAKLGFFGENPLLSLNNSVLRFGEGQTAQPSLTGSSSFAINTAAGTSNTIERLSQQIGANTTINVSAGTSLKVLNSGERGFAISDPYRRLWFNTPANNVVVDGGTLTLDKSHLIVGVTDAATNKTGNFEVKNGGTLSLTESNTALQTNFLTIDGSTLNLGSTTLLSGHAANWTDRPMQELKITNAVVNVFSGGKFQSFLMNASGNNTINGVGAGGTEIDFPAIEALIMADAQSRVTFSGRSDARLYIGTGSVSSSSQLIFNGGTLAITESVPDGSVTLNIGDQGGRVFTNVTPLGANFEVNGRRAQLKIGPNSKFVADGVQTIITLSGRASIFVDGDVGTATFKPATFVAKRTIFGTPDEKVSIGAGSLEVGTGFGATGEELHLQTSLVLNSFSNLNLEIFPSKGNSDLLKIDGRFDIGTLSTLNLSLVNDSVLPQGTKLAIIDYSDTFDYAGHFANYPNNTVFKLGLNTYRIRYSDPDYNGGTNTSVVTLTTVPDFYEFWSNSYYSGAGQTAERAKSANPDGDNLNNWGEFATDGDPTSGANDGKIVGKIATVNSEQVFTLTLPLRVGTVANPADPAGGELGLRQVADGLSYKIQASTDLASWALTVTEVTGADASAIQLGLPALDPDWVYRTFRAPGTVVPGEPKKFMRAIFAD